ncbi:MAG: trigger factor [Alphaproteobacteria bacterium]|nr:trigger factor [Alphaproteobacteria bacterium]
MQVTETLSEGLKRAYTVVLPAADLEGKRSARLAELGRTLRIPGFRPGKVPLPVVRQRYGQAVSAEVLEESVGEATRKVLSERGLRPAVQPKVDLVAVAPDQDLEFKMELEVLPDVHLPEFGGIRLTRFKTEVSPETLERALGNIAERQRSFEDVDEARPAAKGEFLQIDFSGTVEDKPVSGGAGTGADVEVGGEGFVPGFTEQLEGMSPGETKQFALTFPADYPSPELAGKEVQFAVTAKKLRRKVVPALDDELAKQLGLEGIEPLRELVRGQIQREYDQLSRMRLKRQLLDELAKLATFTVPESLVQAEFDQIWRRLEADKAAGQLDDEDRDKDEATLRADYRAIAERRVRLGLLLAEIGRVHNITVNSDEMARAVRGEAGRYPGQENRVLEFFRKNPQAAEHLRGPIFEDKVIDFLVELAQVEDKPVTPEELAREPEAAEAKAE